jgi:hypothetical protein
MLASWRSYRTPGPLQLFGTEHYGRFRAAHISLLEIPLALTDRRPTRRLRPLNAGQRRHPRRIRKKLALALAKTTAQALAMFLNQAQVLPGIPASAPPPANSGSTMPAPAPLSRHRLARRLYNSKAWRRPTSKARESPARTLPNLAKVIAGKPGAGDRAVHGAGSGRYRNRHQSVCLPAARGI